MEDLFVSGIVGFLAGGICASMLISFGKYFGLPGLTGKNFINQEESKKLKMQNQVLIEEIRQMQNKAATLERALEMATGHSLAEPEAQD